MPFFCYLIKSSATPSSKACYIGFSTCPIRRLRQHNGEIVSNICFAVMIARPHCYRTPTKLIDWSHQINKILRFVVLNYIINLGARCLENHEASVRNYFLNAPTFSVKINQLSSIEFLVPTLCSKPSSNFEWWGLWWWLSQAFHQ